MIDHSLPLNVRLAASLAFLLCGNPALALDDPLDTVQINGASGVALDAQLTRYAAAGSPVRFWWRVTNA